MEEGRRTEREVKEKDGGMRGESLSKKEVKIRGNKQRLTVLVPKEDTFKNLYLAFQDEVLD